MGPHLDAARARLGADVRGLFVGGRHALLHTRTAEFDDLRAYADGDDVRDIDWRASARSEHVMVRRFVTERHHRIVIVADAGREMTALAPSGERKGDVAAQLLAALGLVTVGRADEIGLVTGDRRGAVAMPGRRGGEHVEALVGRYRAQLSDGPAPGDGGDVAGLLLAAAEHHRHRRLVVVVSDEPRPTPALTEVVHRVGAGHDLLWVTVGDAPALGSGEAHDRGVYDVTTGAVPLRGVSSARLLAVYRRAEQERVAALRRWLDVHTVGHAHVDGSADIRAALTVLSEAYARVG